MKSKLDSSTVGKTLAWSFLEQGSSKAVAMIVQIVLARMLSPEAFGIMAILLVITNIADVIAQSGLGMALIQKKDAAADSFSTAFWLSIGVAVFLYAAIFFLAPALASFYSSPHLEEYLRVLALVVLFNSANAIQRAFLQRLMDFKSLFKVSLFALSASGVLGICLAYAEMGIWALVAQSLSQSIFTFAAMLIFLPWKPSLVFRPQEASELFRYGWKVSVTGILNVLYTGISELVIGKTCSAESLGYYSQGRKYPLAAIGILSNSIANVAFPAFASLKDDSDALRSGLRKALSVGTFIIAPTSLLFVVIAEPTIELLLTKAWLPCVPVFQLTCLANSLLMFQLVNLRAYMALGDSALYLKLQIIKVFAGGFAICAVAIITNDIYATAATTGVAGIISVLFVDMVPAKRMHGYGWFEQVRDQSRTYLSAIIASAAAGFTQILALFPVAQILLQVIIFAGVYIGFCALLRVPALKECIQIAQNIVDTKAK